MLTLLWTAMALAGALGALARWRLDFAVRGLVSRCFHKRPLRPGARSAATHREPAVPPMLGIVLVNVLGSFLLALLAAAPMTGPVGSGARFAASTGFLGGFTTFSTAVVDCWTLWSSGRRAASIALLVGGWACSLLALFAGIGLGALL